MTNPLYHMKVSRMMTMIKESVERVGNIFADQPNDDISRQLIKSTIDEFLGDVANRGAVGDYTVVCDESNNPSGTIDHNEMHIDIFIKPVTPLGDDGALRSIIMPMIIKLDPMTVAQDIVGVQPMEAPTGEIFTVRPSYLQEYVASFDGDAETRTEDFIFPKDELAEPPKPQIVGTGRLKPSTTGPTVLPLPTGPTIGL